MKHSSTAEQTETETSLGDSPKSLAIARLRRQKEQAEVELQGQGNRDGASFVLQRANYRSLKRLATFRDHAQGTLWYPESIHEVTRIMVGPECDQSDLNEMVRELEESFGCNVHEEGWISGFIEGALDQFDEINEAL